MTGPLNRGYAGLISLLITAALILMLTALYFVPSDDEEDDDEARIQHSGASAVEKANTAVLRIRLVEVRQSLQMFNAVEGRFPESLDELCAGSSYTVNPLPGGYEYVYTPDRGTVVIAKDGNTVCK